MVSPLLRNETAEKFAALDLNRIRAYRAFRGPLTRMRAEGSSSRLPSFRLQKKYRTLPSLFMVQEARQTRQNLFKPS
jgi:hypothetical protein